MQQSFVSNAVDVELLSIDLTGKTQSQLADLAHQALGESLNLARRSVESAWFAGKVLERAKRNVKYGQWRNWLEEHGIEKDTDWRVRKLYNEYQLSQLATFDTMSGALRAIPKRAQPTPEPEPQPTVTHPIGEPVEGEITTSSNGPVVAVDIITGEVKEFPQDHQPTESEQIYAREGKEQPIDTSGGVHKERETIQEWQPKTHKLKYRKSKQGIPIDFDIAVGDEVTMTGAELFYLVKNFVLIGNPPKDSVAFKQGDVI